MGCRTIWCARWNAGAWQLGKPLSPDQTERYEQDGYLFPVPVLAPSEVAEVRHSVEELTAACSGQAGRLSGTNFYFQWAFELAAHPDLLDKIESVMGPDILVWGTLILSKAPTTRGFVTWHQDSAYTDFLNGSPALSAWIALTPATRQNGCMRVIPGSHGRRLAFTTDRHPDEMTIRGHRVLGDFDPNDAVDMALQPGEASLHEVSLIHGSDANESDQPRTGFIVRYATPAMSQPDYPVQCVRGNSGNIVCVDGPAKGSSRTLDSYVEYFHAEIQAAAATR